MNLRDEIKKLTEKERKIVAILSGWTILHLILNFISDGSKTYFWPFDKDPGIKTNYDFSEFAVYGLIPWVILIIYRFLMNSKNN
jgi:hypothetical protein